MKDIKKSEIVRGCRKCFREKPTKCLKFRWELYKYSIEWKESLDKKIGKKGILCRRFNKERRREAGLGMDVRIEFLLCLDNKNSPWN